TPLRRQICGNSSVGRAQPCQGWGREFESRFPLQILFRQPCCTEEQKRASGLFFVPALCRYWQQGSLPLDELVLVPPGSPLFSATPSASRNVEYRQERAPAR